MPHIKQPSKNSVDAVSSRRDYALVKKDGSEIKAQIPATYTVGQAKGVLGEKAGFEPQFVDGDQGLSLRLAVETDGDSGLRLLPDELRFEELEEGTRLHPIPSLAPAAGPRT
jgi:hypothetical protein